MARLLISIRGLALGAAAAGFGCGGSAKTSFAGLDGSSPGSSAAPDFDAGAPDDVVTIPYNDGGALVFAPQTDAASGTVQSACTAGVYRGSFMTYVGTGSDGGSPGPFSFMWNGNLSIDLTAKKIVVSSTSGNGENFATDTSLLEIADGGAIDGGDNFGGNFFADLDGELDCDLDAGPPFHLNATFSNGLYRDSFLSIPLGGNMTAEYQSSAPPMLIGGQILVQGFLADSGTIFSSASGTWSATWVSP
jgi:hypothetical protein